MTNSANYRLPGIGTTSRTLEQSPSGEASDETCACGHPYALHDRIAARYCAVTVEGSLTRNCICPASSAEPPEPPS